MHFTLWVLCALVISGSSWLSILEPSIEINWMPQSKPSLGDIRLKYILKTLHSQQGWIYIKIFYGDSVDD